MKGGIFRVSSKNTNQRSYDPYQLYLEQYERSRKYQLRRYGMLPDQSPVSEQTLRLESKLAFESMKDAAPAQGKRSKTSMETIIKNMAKNHVYRFSTAQAKGFLSVARKMIQEDETALQRTAFNGASITSLPTLTELRAGGPAMEIVKDRINELYREKKAYYEKHKDERGGATAAAAAKKWVSNTEFGSR